MASGALATLHGGGRPDRAPLLPIWPAAAAHAGTTQVYTANDTFTVPAGVTSLTVQVVGAGGGGGSAYVQLAGQPGPDQNRGGGGGGTTSFISGTTEVWANGGGGGGGGEISLHEGGDGGRGGRGGRSTGCVVDGLTTPHTSAFGRNGISGTSTAGLAHAVGGNGGGTETDPSTLVQPGTDGVGVVTY